MRKKTTFSPGLWPSFSGCFGRLGFSQKTPAANAGFLEKRGNLPVVTVVYLVHHFLDAGSDDHFCAEETGTVRAIKHGAFQRHAVIGGLDNGVFLGVRADAVTKLFTGWRVARAAGAPAFVAVADTAGCAVVAGGNYPVFFHNHGHHLPPQAITAAFDDMSNVHKVRVPVRSG